MALFGENPKKLLERNFSHMTLTKRFSFIALLLVSVFVFAPVAKADQILDSKLSGSRETLDDIGTAASNSRDYVGWVYKPAASHDICSVWVYIYKTGSPIDQVNVSINSYPFDYSTTTASSFFDTWQTLGNSQLTVSASTDTIYEFEFSPCVTVIGASWYSIVVSRTGARDNSNHYQMLEDLPSPCGATNVGTGYTMFARQLHDGSFIKYDNILCGGNLVINGLQNFSAFQPPGATTTASTLSGDCSEEGFLSGSICYMWQYLFVPDSNMLDEWVDFVEIIKTKIPFSYFYEIYDSITGQSTTGSQSPITSLSFVASSTALNITYSPFSTTTAVQYMGQTLYDVYQTMMRYAVLAGFGFYVFYRVKALMAPVN